MPTPVAFDAAIGRQFIKYARLVAGRGYVHNTLGNIVMRVAHPDFPHGLAYTKHAEISLEEMELENIVITDVPSSRIVWGERMTSVGHNLSREILRLRPDINATRSSRCSARAHRTCSTCCRSIPPSCSASRCISCRPMSMSRPT